MVAPLVAGAVMELARYAAPKLVRYLTNSETAEEATNRVLDVSEEILGTRQPQEALARVKADPNLALQFNIRSQEIEADLDKAYLADRQDARKRDIAYIQAGLSNKRADLMILLDVVGLIVCLWLMYAVRDMPGEMRGILGMIASYFGLGLRDAHQFEFGSSRGSKQKDMRVI